MDEAIQHVPWFPTWSDHESFIFSRTLSCEQWYCTVGQWPAAHVEDNMMLLTTQPLPKRLRVDGCEFPRLSCRKRKLGDDQQIKQQLMPEQKKLLFLFSPIVVTGPHILELPEDILLYIFSFLDVCSIGRCARVCQRWRNLDFNYLYFGLCCNRGFLTNNDYFPACDYVQHFRQEMDLVENPFMRYCGRPSPELHFSEQWDMALIQTQLQHQQGSSQQQQQDTEDDMIIM